MIKSLWYLFIIIGLHLSMNLTANSAPINSCPDGMVFIPGGTFTIGSNHHYIEEQVAKNVKVDSFCIDAHEVTNQEFAQFVQATGYITVSERPLSVEEFPTLSETEREPGSIVFTMPKQEQETIGYLGWWKWVKGANWRHPNGPNSNIQGKENHPVVQISFEDAQAYAQWIGKSLPTESQWEYAARGGKTGKTYTWGDEYSAKKANTWQGIFPFVNTKEDGYIGTAPVGSFSPNNYGLYDITGNVWEWTLDWYQVGHNSKNNQLNPIMAKKEESFDPREPGIAKHVIKGGSYLCAPNYCSRYRPAAREAQEPNTGTSHIGFRLVQGS